MVVTALERHRCPACAAGCAWSAATQRLVCGSCGSDAIAQPDLRPHKATRDLGVALGEIDETDAQCRLPRRTVQCRGCQGELTFDGNVIGRACDFCGAAVLLGYEDIGAAVQPQAVLTFAVDPSRARDEFRNWLNEQPLTPGNIARRVRVERIDSRYVPCWTFDTAMQCFWHADAGYYEEKEIYVTDSKGNREQRTVTVTRWEPAAGVLEDRFLDEPVSGSDELTLTEVGPFPTAESVPFDPGCLAGYQTEHYRVPLAEASRRWYALMWTKLTALCAERVPGDTQRNLRIETFYKGQAFRLVLVPVMLLTYSYRRTQYRVVVNGRTGRMHGDSPVSSWKFAFVLLALAVGVGLVIALVVWLVRLAAP
jgi:ribosomal protein S27AE